MASSSPPPDVEATLGRISIGVFLATFLYGIETLQTFNYYRAFPEDKRALKILVGGIWLLELANTIGCWHALYTMTVTFYGQPAHIVNLPRSFVFTTLVHAIINIVVQTFFALRVRALSQRWLMTILCCILNFLRLIGDIALFTALWEDPNLLHLGEKWNWLVTTTSSIGPVVDVMIAASLCYYLWRSRKSSGFSKQTNNVVDTIIIWTVETTSITTVSALLQLILFLARKDLTWMIFYLIETKFFSNSLLASLNGRQRFRSVDLQHSPHVISFDREARVRRRTTMQLNSVIVVPDDDDTSPSSKTDDSVKTRPHFPESAPNFGERIS
ncbi:hypothetical protein C8R44DRAFT_992024 [Mycena epipterygia]|nr:hypothetical protein C8R44DRAFT_992024 [Mycena epipterygia]